MHIEIKKSITFCGFLAREQRSGLGDRKKDELQKDKKGIEFLGGVRSAAFTLDNTPTGKYSYTLILL